MIASGFVVNFANGNRNKATCGGFLRCGSLGELFAVATQLVDGGMRVWFDTPGDIE